MPARKQPIEEMPPLREEDIGGPNWGSQVSGLTPAQIVAKAKAGEIPGAWQLGRGIYGWRFCKSQFLKWLQTQIQKSHS